VTSVGRIGFEGKDLVLPRYNGGRGGKGAVAKALFEQITDIQEGKSEWENWGMPCE